jgi:hypothetical protein
MGGDGRLQPLKDDQMTIEKANPSEAAGAGLIARPAIGEQADAVGFYAAECYAPDGTLRWREEFPNVVCTEGKNSMLQHALKGSAYTAGTLPLGLITSTSYTAVAAGNTAGSITTASGSPANGWNEAPSSIATPRGSVTLGTPSSGSVSASSSVSFSILASATIKGAFLLMKDAAGTAPTTAVGNTSGALWSAGTFTGGDRTVQSGDTLNVSYTTSL